MTATLIVENVTTLNDWSEECSRVFTVFSSKHTSKYKCLLDAYVGNTMLTGTMTNFAGTSTQNMASSLSTAIGQLCNTKHPENLRKARQLLLVTIPELLIFYQGALADSNRAFVKGFLDILKDEELPHAIPLMFAHLSDTELHHKCYEMSQERLTNFVIIKSGNVKSFVQPEQEKLLVQMVRKNQLEMIQHNIETLIQNKPFLIPKIIDFLNTNILNDLLAVCIANPTYLENLLASIFGKTGEAYQTDSQDSFISFKKLGLLICCHCYISQHFLDYFSKIFELSGCSDQIRIVKAYYDKLQGFKSDKKELLTLEPCDVKNLEDELLMRHQWCLVTESVFRENFDNFDADTIQWLEKVRDQFIRCFDISSQLPALGAATININSTLKRVLHLMGKLGVSNPDYVNCWLASFLNKLGEVLNGKGDQWFTMLIIETIAKGMTKELLPNLENLEAFHEKYNPFKKKNSLIYAYSALIENGCSNDVNVINKALVNCIDLDTITRFKPETETQLYDMRSIYFEKAVDFTIRFEKIFLAGFDLLFVNLAKESFVDSLNTFRSQTDKSLQRVLYATKILPKKLFETINKNLKYLGDDISFNALMDYLNSNSIIDLPETYSHLIVYSIFKGPAFMGGQNIYLSALGHKYLTEICNINVTMWDNSEFAKNSLKWCILENSIIPSPFKESIITKAVNDESFRKIFLTSMKEVSAELDGYKDIRPQFASWYDLWIKRAYNMCDLIRQAIQTPHQITSIN